MVEIRHFPAHTLHAVVRHDNFARHVESWSASRSVVHAAIKRAQTLADVSAALPVSRPLIVLLELGDATPEAIAEIERMQKRLDERCALVVALSNVQTGDMRRLMRAGVNDILAPHADAEEVNATLDALARSLPAGSANAGGPGLLFPILKTGGGVGGSLIAINLARELAHRQAGRIALIDLDIQFGSIDIALDVEPRLNLTDAIRAGDRLDATMLRSMMTPHKSGFDILANGKSIAPVDVVTDTFMERLTAQLKQTYDYVLLDMPMTWSPWFYTAATHADALLTIVEPSVKSADGSRRIMQGLSDLGIAKPKLIPIANRADKTPDVKRRLQRIADILETPCDLLVRDDARTAGAASDLGECAREVAATAPLTVDIEAIAARLSAARTESPSVTPVRDNLSKFRLFGRNP